MSDFAPDPAPWDGEPTQRLPSSPEAEHAVIGAALYDNEAFRLVEDMLSGRNFFEPMHGRIWDAIGDQVRRGARAEPVGIMEKLKNDEALSDVGGLSFLGLLVDHAPSARDAPHFAEIVADLSIKREMIRVAGEIASEAQRPEAKTSGMEQVAVAEKRLAELATVGPQKQTFERLGPVYLRQLHRSRGLNGKAPGIPTGIPSLDALMGGIRRSTMNTIAGRPGMGKSAVGIEIAKNIATAGIPVAYFSAEMPEEQVATRFGCSLVYDRNAPVYSGKTSNPTYEDFEKGELTEAQWDRLEKGYELLDKLPIYMDFVRPTVSHMAASTRRLLRDIQKDHGTSDLVAITDHMLKVKSERTGRADPAADLTQVSNDMLEMYKSLGIGGINLMQLNRGVEGRDDKRPNLSDLKQSGTVEEDSFSVSFLVRPSYYNRPPEDDDDDKGWAKFQKIKARWDNKLLWILEKNRGGRGQQQLELFCDIGANVIQDLNRESRDETGRILFPTSGDIFGEAE